MNTPTKKRIIFISIAVLSFISHIQNKNISLNAEPIIVPTLTETKSFDPNSFNDIFSTAFTLNDIDSWDSLISNKLDTLQNEWEINADKEIFSYVNSVSESDSYNGIENYKDYLFKELNSQKTNALLDWEDSAVKLIISNRDDFLSDLSQRINSNQEIFAGNKLNESEIDLSKNPEMITEIIDLNRANWLEGFKQSNSKGLKEFGDTLALVNSNYEKFIKELGSFESSIDGNLSIINGYRDAVLNSIKDKILDPKTGFEAILNDPNNASIYRNPDNTFNSAGREFYSLINELKTKINNKEDLSSLSLTMVSYLETQKEIFTSKALIHENSINTYMMNDSYDYRYNRDMNDIKDSMDVVGWNGDWNQTGDEYLVLKKIKNFMDNKDNIDYKQLLVNYLNEKYSYVDGSGNKSDKWITQIYDANIFANTPSPPDGFGQVNTRIGGNYSTDGDSFKTYTSRSYVCVGYMLCGYEEHDNIESSISYKVTFNVYNKKEEELKNYYSGLETEFSTQLNDWSANLLPAIKNWDTQTSDYINYANEWKRQAQIIKERALEDKNKAESDLIQKESEWISEEESIEKRANEKWEALYKDAEKALSDGDVGSLSSILSGEPSIEVAETKTSEIFESFKSSIVELKNSKINILNATNNKSINENNSINEPEAQDSKEKSMNLFENKNIELGENSEIAKDISKIFSGFEKSINGAYQLSYIEGTNQNLEMNALIQQKYLMNQYLYSVDDKYILKDEKGSPVYDENKNIKYTSDFSKEWESLISSGACYSDPSKCKDFMKANYDVNKSRIENGQIVLVKIISDGTLQKGSPENDKSIVNGAYYSGTQEQEIRVNLAGINHVQLQDPVNGKNKSIFSNWGEEDFETIASISAKNESDFSKNIISDMSRINASLEEAAKTEQYYANMFIESSQNKIKQDEQIEQLAQSYFTGGIAGVKSAVNEMINNKINSEIAIGICRGLNKPEGEIETIANLVSILRGRIENEKIDKQINSPGAKIIKNTAAIGTLSLAMGNPILTSALGNATSYLNSASAIAQGAVAIKSLNISSAVQKKDIYNENTQNERVIIKNHLVQDVARTTNAPIDLVSKFIDGMDGRESARKSKNLDSLSPFASVYGITGGIIKNALVATGIPERKIDNAIDNSFKTISAFTTDKKIEGAVTAIRYSALKASGLAVKDSHYNSGDINWKDNKAIEQELVQKAMTRYIIEHTGLSEKTANSLIQGEISKINQRSEDKKARTSAIDNSIQTAAAIGVTVLTAGGGVATLASAINTTVQTANTVAQVANIAIQTAIGSKNGKKGIVAGLLNGALSAVTQGTKIPGLETISESLGGLKNLGANIGIHFDKRTGYGISAGLSKIGPGFGISLNEKGDGSFTIGYGSAANLSYNFKNKSISASVDAVQIATGNGAQFNAGINIDSKDGVSISGKINRNTIITVNKGGSKMNENILGETIDSVFHSMIEKEIYEEHKRELQLESDFNPDSKLELEQLLAQEKNQNTGTKITLIDNVLDFGGRTLDSIEIALSKIKELGSDFVDVLTDNPISTGIGALATSALIGLGIRNRKREEEPLSDNEEIANNEEQENDSIKKDEFFEKTQASIRALLNGELEITETFVDDSGIKYVILSDGSIISENEYLQHCEIINREEFELEEAKVETQKQKIDPKNYQPISKERREQILREIKKLEEERREFLENLEKELASDDDDEEEEEEEEEDSSETVERAPNMKKMQTQKPIEKKNENEVAKPDYIYSKGNQISEADILHLIENIENKEKIIKNGLTDEEQKTINKLMKGDMNQYFARGTGHLGDVFDDLATLLKKHPELLDNKYYRENIEKELTNRNEFYDYQDKKRNIIKKLKNKEITKEESVEQIKSLGKVPSLGSQTINLLCVAASNYVNLKQLGYNGSFSDYYFNSINNGVITNSYGKLANMTPGKIVNAFKIDGKELVYKRTTGSAVSLIQAFIDSDNKVATLRVPRVDKPSNDKADHTILIYKTTDGNIKIADPGKGSNTGTMFADKKTNRYTRAYYLDLINKKK